MAAVTSVVVWAHVGHWLERYGIVEQWLVVATSRCVGVLSRQYAGRRVIEHDNKSLDRFDQYEL